MLDQRTSGILLHPTSLPGPHGSGDFGPSAYHFVDWLHAAGQRFWQVLPLNPVGPGYSPYAGASAFAGAPSLVALEPLIEKGWLAQTAAQELSAFNARRVDYGSTMAFRHRQLERAAEGFFARASKADKDAFDAFCAREAKWLDDYALFMALDAAQNAGGGEFRAWPQWDKALARREAAALTAARKQLAQPLQFWKFVQWCFDTQWANLRDYARGKGVAIIGDLPIFIAHHSADCWSRPDLYLLDDAFAPTVVAGVPPDFFSATGQRWGNPLYRWDAFERENYQWWIDRVQRQLKLADVVRIDHFRGFAGYWEIPASCPTAIEGHWVPGPGEKLFNAIARATARAGGAAPIIAEDLGVITPDVEQLRDQFHFPGMRILQFGFSDGSNHSFLPHNYIANTVVYTGTHDNDTARGWWNHCTERERGYAAAYLNTDGSDVHWAMIRAASSSVANTVIIAMQDVMGLDSAHRMNTPGTMGCWEWRFAWDMVASDAARQLASISAAYGRAPMSHLALKDYPAGTPHP
ncbi:MAG: 4-alpha-glucanotransferase [Burkholderiaceae bacterium]